jgi:addiction module HigA family antidote
MRQYNLPHPGEVLRDALGEMTVTEAAKRLRISRMTLSKILNGRNGITAEMSRRLSAAFGSRDSYWHNMQRDYDMQKAREKKLPKIVPFKKAA